jgi:hypothetical protein
MEYYLLGGTVVFALFFLIFNFLKVFKGKSKLNEKLKVQSEAERKFEEF